MIFDVHIFVCTNQRSSGEKRSCGEAHGLELVSEFKKYLKNSDLKITARANRSGCLGICDFGPTVAVYPEGIFYVGVKKSDVAEIIQSHIIGGKPVDRLVLKGWKP
jgi:(2Fe-2S) ferredoxin